MKKRGGVVYRELKAGDIPQITQMICEFWELDITCGSEKEGMAVSLAYLKKCLLHTSFAIVLEEDRNIKGFILARQNGEKKLSIGNKIQSSSVSDSEKCQKLLADMSQYDKICQGLKEKNAKNFSGEIILFVVAEKYRGRGIGKKLYSYVLEYFRKTSCEKFYLYTDSNCTYQFYAVQGLVRLGEDVMKYPGKSSKQMKIYIYGNKCA